MGRKPVEHDAEWFNERRKRANEASKRFYKNHPDYFLFVNTGMRELKALRKADAIPKDLYCAFMTGKTSEERGTKEC